MIREAQISLKSTKIKEKVNECFNVCLHEAIEVHDTHKHLFHLLLATRFLPTGPSASFPCKLASNDWS